MTTQDKEGQIDKVQTEVSNQNEASEPVQNEKAEEYSTVSSEITVETDGKALETTPETKVTEVKEKKAKKKSAKKAVAKTKSAPQKPTKKAVEKAKPKASPKAEPEVMKQLEKFVAVTYKHPTTFKEMETIMTKNKVQLDKLAQEANALGRESTEAFIKAGNIFAKGFEEIVKTSMTMAQDAAEKQAKFVKEAMSTKTLNEWAEVQHKIVQTNFDDLMSGATKISELSVKVLTDGVEPLNEQANKAILKATDAIAA